MDAHIDQFGHGAEARLAGEVAACIRRLCTLWRSSADPRVLPMAECVLEASLRADCCVAAASTRARVCPQAPPGPRVPLLS